jgi:hypothetical protein
VRQPIFNVIDLATPLVILDSAFLPSIRSVEDIFKTRVSLPRQSLKLDLEEEFFNVPICRKPVSTSSRMTTDNTKPLKYHNYLYFLERLSLAVGMIRAVKPYDLRRGTSEAVNSKFL